ncbi:MAG TPA: acyl-CoA dehydrogenase family protein [Actinomycetota bacterium]|nr:acyl-CoA dehydrogenase family protein [Actinomycetota bacterium]
MNFELDEQERALQQGIRELCAGKFPLERIRQMETTGLLDRTLWRELGDAGVFSLRLPESKGGAGLGWTEAVLVYEELGRALVPGPVVSTHLAARLIDGAATGERVVGLAGRTGERMGAVHFASLDDLIVLDHEGVWRVDPADVKAEPVTRPLDPLTPAHILGELPRGERLARHLVAARWRVLGDALAAAQLAGIAAAVTELAVAYAKERRQFDRPIGSFQAVKHLLADMHVRAEVARAAVHAAGVALDRRSEMLPVRAVSGAKVLAADAAVANGRAAVQVHGGMGFTWEVPVHLYLKRAAVLSAAFGAPDELAESLAASL